MITLRTTNLLEKGWAKTQPFGKRLNQNPTFWKKVQEKQTEPKPNTTYVFYIVVNLSTNYNSIRLGFGPVCFQKVGVLVQPFGKRLS